MEQFTGVTELYRGTKTFMNNRAVWIRDDLHE